VHKTYTDVQKKLQGPPTLRGDTVRIFRGLNFHDAFCLRRLAIYVVMGIKVPGIYHQYQKNNNENIQTISESMKQ
jgi:hypothetical protein